MCGLVGILDKFIDASQLKTFKWMLHLDVIRGEDSTGVAFREGTTKDGFKTRTYKAVGRPHKLFNKYPEVFGSDGTVVKKSDPISFLMGHNRAKTVGGSLPGNAHPFHVEHIVGCHNGTIRTGLHKLPDNKEGETDSEQIYRALAEGQDLQEIVDSLNGAMALTWWNARDKTFNLFRNSERPLKYAYSRGRTAFYYASEDWILEQSLKKTKSSGTIDKIEDYPVDTHMVFSLDNLKIELVNERKVTKKTYVSQASSNTRSSTNVVKYPKSHGKEEVFNDTGWVDVRFSNKEDFNKSQAKYGCSLCQTTLDYGEYVLGEVFWLDRETPLCSSCSADFSQGEA